MRRRFITHGAAVSAQLEHMLLERITGTASMSAVRAIAESDNGILVTPTNASSTVSILRIPDSDKEQISRAAQRFNVLTPAGTLDMPRGYWSGAGWFVHNPRN